MRPIPEKMKREMSVDPYYEKCAICDGKCQGIITWEHCWIYAGRQINEKWAIIPICEFHHGLGIYFGRGGLNKNINQLISLMRATPEDLIKYPKVDWGGEFRRVLYNLKNEDKTGILRISEERGISIPGPDEIKELLARLS